MEKIFSPHLHLAKNYWKAHLRSEDLAIDATCGNGNDTLFLAGRCTVIGLDIQKSALQNTEKLLAEARKKASLHLLSHGEIDTLCLPYPPRLIVYNLGYLPKGDKSITTKKETTLASLQKAFRLLAPDGAISITCYPGHEEGQREEEAIVEVLSALPSKSWSICHHKWLNRARSPSFIWIEAVQKPLFPPKSCQEKYAVYKSHDNRTLPLQ